MKKGRPHPVSRLFPSTDRRPTAHKRPTTRRVTMEQLENRSLLAHVWFRRRFPASCSLPSTRSVTPRQLLRARAPAISFCVGLPTQGGSTRFAVLVPLFMADGTLDNSFGSAGFGNPQTSTTFYFGLILAYPPTFSRPIPAARSSPRFPGVRGDWHGSDSRISPWPATTPNGPLDSTYRLVVDEERPDRFGTVGHRRRCRALPPNAARVNGLLVQDRRQGSWRAGVTSTLTIGRHRWLTGSLTARWPATHPAGKLDTTFGGTGIVSKVRWPLATCFSDGDHPAGKILAVGSPYQSAHNQRHHPEHRPVPATTPNGTLDTSFRPRPNGDRHLRVSVLTMTADAPVAVNADGASSSAGYSANAQTGDSVSPLRGRPNTDPGRKRFTFTTFGSMGALAQQPGLANVNGRQCLRPARHRHGPWRPGCAFAVQFWLGWTTSLFRPWPASHPQASSKHHVRRHRHGDVNSPR